jgi:DNA modification methylase
MMPIQVRCAYDQLLRLSECIPNPDNPRSITPEKLERLKSQLKELGIFKPAIIDESGVILGGNMRHKALLELEAEGYTVEYPVSTFKGTEEERRVLVLADNSSAGEYDIGALGEYVSGLEDDFPDLDMELIGLGQEELVDMGVIPEETEYPPVEAEDDIPDVVVKNPITKRGDVWELGKHRLRCGDATMIDDIEKLMDGETVDLLFCDPPYGMGKEKDGVKNDNLYKEKLDQFQMEWFIAAYTQLKTTSSVYIWGNAEDLWRLWFIGGLKEFRRFTFRNEIIWDKKSGQGINSEAHRMYPTVTERCLFFMLGEQGFNTNADNYWDGWEPIRKYLYDERINMGWDIPTMKKIVGHLDLNRDHWTGKSQWSFIPEDCYKALQATANGQGFKKDYEVLKKEFYDTRAYFNNTHENMTDVWSYPSVTGGERHGHPTPKPVTLVTRAVKSSSPDSGVVLDLFGGSGTTLIACEQSGRRAMLMELDEKYCDVIIERYVRLVGNTGITLNGEKYEWND